MKIDAKQRKVRDSLFAMLATAKATGNKQAVVAIEARLQKQEWRNVR